MRARSIFVPRGDAAAKVQRIRAYIERAKRDPAFHRLALRIPRDYGVAEYDWMGELGAVKDFVHRHVRYTRDPAGLETFRTPQATLRVGAGDCDDVVALGAALVETLGYHTRLDVVRSPRRRGWSHIKFDVGVPPGVPDRWVPMELTMRSFTVGRDAPGRLVAERAYFTRDGRVRRVENPPRRFELQGVGGSTVLGLRGRI